MELILGTAAGALMGSAAGRANRKVNGGWWLNLLSGIVGGLLGALWLGPVFTDYLYGSTLAGAAAGGALGGAVLALLVGAIKNRHAYRD